MQFPIKLDLVALSKSLSTFPKNNQENTINHMDGLLLIMNN